LIEEAMTTRAASDRYSAVIDRLQAVLDELEADKQ
jgi:hypothetical protein